MDFKISFNKIECPVCNSLGKFYKNDYEIICECGYVLITPYPYVAGVKLNTELKSSDKC